MARSTGTRSTKSKRGRATSKRSATKRSTARRGATKKTTTRRRATSTARRKYSPKAGREVATEMRHKRSGKHPVKNRKQAIAIGLSKARRKGVKVPAKK